MCGPEGDERRMVAEVWFRYVMEGAVARSVMQSCEDWALLLWKPAPYSVKKFSSRVMSWLPEHLGVKQLSHP